MASQHAGVLFDLDGTLLDTAPDMAAALNALRAEEGLSPMPFHEVRPHVSHGSVRLIQVGFDDPEPVRFEELRRRFLDIYRGAIAVATRPFEGFDAVLDSLERHGIAWGIVTNKPGWLTEPLLDTIGLLARAGCVVSGDTLPERKPHPRPLLHAASLLGIAPGACVYVGDAERDVQAAVAAGMIPVIALFGYLGEQDDPASWGAQALIGSPIELLDWLALDAGDEPA